MYQRYAIRRILDGILVYAVIVLALSALFNSVADRTVRALIDEEVRQSMSKMKGVRPEDFQLAFQSRVRERERAYWLDRPVGERIARRTVATLTFDFGKSTIVKSSAGSREVAAIIGEALPRTLLLFTTEAILVVTLGVALGLRMARRPGGPLDRATSLATMIVYGMPSWWVGMILIMLFVYIVPVFPSGGLHTLPPLTGFARLLDVAWHMVLPLATLVLIGFWGTALVVRNIVLGVLQEDFVMAARARGIPERKVLRGHTLRTAAPPVATMAILMLVGSLGGNLVFEGIFSWPGLGNLYWIALQQMDVPLVLGLLSVTTGLYVFALVLLDLAYGFLDPRIKTGGAA
ncbi:MAG: ABC transporter permease [Spirochaetaceae bacterium]|nr:ABC transporter permease [Spirochaetaceae bacterium]